ncbi:ABC transporter ATP-binding protein [Clostridium baratii]|uniref:ABC transporter ATP-binding protein n=1 Tax=Clostridium baratii TaxID=1561 RepID=UPI0009A2BFF9|nr:ABC transporter ATP-binding protein [Clostridium baratii]OPF51161.1 ABC transporter ATP-binding protein [Clostridium baratii]OPF55762.1 ABC transporter ATP-binding protein [Clostridium baratii]OPF56858.1 ABC transporter ATP-binding protein [Clostridium baratii]OPF59857.1 ABC transporter ATP-binding protein [Clostridium baratii]
MNVIEIKDLTKDYGNNKGIFDVNLTVKKGEVFGFLGLNGAGKTTTIRHLMGFVHSDKGKCLINGIDCSKESDKIQEKLGYLPGEIAFMDDMTGIEFIHFIADMKGLKDFNKALELIKMFELDPKGKIKKMSKGMKQKIGIVCAFMGNPDILILDEPTSGLDPLMQNRFVELILSEKEKGKTIFMSSHIFDEIEKTCDRTAIIKDGHVVAVENMKTLSNSKHKSYVITFLNDEIAKEFSKENLKIKEVIGNVVTVSVKGDINPLIKALSKYSVTSLDVKTESLEELFMHFYGGESND